MKTTKLPQHPGKSVCKLCLGPSRLCVAEGAQVLGVTRQSFSSLINGKAGISPEMAIRLSKAFGSPPKKWITMQGEYDLAQALRGEKRIRVRKRSGTALETAFGFNG
jgi:addiction module HigA family antidote